LVPCHCRSVRTEDFPATIVPSFWMVGQDPLMKSPCGTPNDPVQIPFTEFPSRMSSRSPQSGTSFARVNLLVTVFWLVIRKSALSRLTGKASPTIFHWKSGPVSST